jgi:hypothetical protein
VAATSQQISTTLDPQPDRLLQFGAGGHGDAVDDLILPRRPPEICTVATAAVLLAFSAMRPDGS